MFIFIIKTYIRGRFSIFYKFLIIVGYTTAMSLVGPTTTF